MSNNPLSHRIRSIYFRAIIDRMKKSLRKKQERKEKVKSEKYILWVTTELKDGGYSSRWYGWTRKLSFSYEDALKAKELIKDRYFDVEIVKL